MMKLYMTHCGFYDKSFLEGIFEQHVNLFVIAQNFEEAKLNAKNLDVVKEKNMHIDGILEINAVSGYNIRPILDSKLGGITDLKANQVDWK